MKKLFLTILLGAAALGATAQDFVMPEPIVITPISGSELFYGQVQVTWGFYPLKLVDTNAAVTFHFPDGTTNTVKPRVADVNPEGEFESRYPNPPAIANNGLDFLKVDFVGDDIFDNDSYKRIPGTYTFTLPAGLVEINGVKNEEKELSFYIGGIREVKTMPRAELVYPTSEYASYLSGMEVMWNGGQEVAFADGSESKTVTVEIDGGSVRYAADARVTNIIEGDEATGETREFTILVVDLPELVSYTDATIVDFILPEGLVVNEDGEVNPDQMISFTLLPTSEGNAFPGNEYTFDEAEGNRVVVTWDGIQLTRGTGDLAFRKISVDPYEEWNPSYSFADEEAEMTIELPALTPGLYELVIPGGFVLVQLSESGDNAYALNSEMYLQYEVSKEAGVTVVKPVEADAQYYNLQGVKVSNPEKGIFIVNGVKVVK